VVQFTDLIYAVIFALSIFTIVWLVFSILHRFKKPQIYFISDTHFGHEKIIELCNRPFKNTKMMDREMRDRWNETVNKKDIVYFIGDFHFRGSSTGYWITHLNGRKIFIEGNHDLEEDDGVIHHKIKGAVYHKIVESGGYKFYLVHDPHNVPDYWTDWVIFGHEHNNNISKYPFIEGERRQINVSVEVIDYRPVSLEYLLSLDLNSIKRKNTIRSRTIYK
jgi:calcineurin-like phosphoesterase family protein